MNNNLTHCPNCNTKLKDGFLNSITIAQPSINQIINMYNDNKVEAHCTKCIDDLARIYVPKFKREKLQILEQYNNAILQIPVITINNPLAWEYQVIDMVTAQTTTGTGVISEVTTSITDLFGMQSGRYNDKLKAGENLCLAQLRKQTYSLGGNAVIATDIDYSEVGGMKGMLMVCMSGTAIKLKNLDILGKEKSEQINNIPNVIRRYKELDSIITAGNYDYSHEFPI